MNIRELARLAKVSPATVSFALRDSPKISKITKDRIRRLAERNGYRCDARVVDMMRHLRKPRNIRETACFAVISFYDTPRPWEHSEHLRRMYEGMMTRARELGYRLEPLWLRAPGMTYRRFRSILDARGIEGLLCFGSPDFDQEFPVELGRYAVVTQGLSIRTPLHRVISDSYNDTVEALNRLYQYKYRRPGLVIGRFEDLRGAHKHAAAYLGWCEQSPEPMAALPILRLDDVEADKLLSWLRHERPDAVLFVHVGDVLDSFRKILTENRVKVPRDLGVLVISPVIADRDFCGLEENQQLIGTWAVELLAARIANRDFGIPVNPRIEMVESVWRSGPSLLPLR